MLVEGLIFIVVLLYLYGYWACNYWRRRGVFQLEYKLIFGNVMDVLLAKKSLPDLAADIYKVHKDKGIVGFYSFFRPVLLVTNPTLARQVMVKDFNNFSAVGFEVSYKTEPFVAYNPFGYADYEGWKEVRTMHAHLFTPSKLKLLPNLLAKSAKKMEDYIRKSSGKPIKVKDVCDLFTIDSITSFGYGLEATAFEDPENIFRKNAKDTIFTSSASHFFNCGFLYPMIGWVASTRLFSNEVYKFFTAFTNQIISERSTSGIDRGDAIDALVKLIAKRKAEGKKEMSEDEKAAAVFAPYVDSVTTTGMILASFVKDLAKYQEVQDKIRAEIISAGTSLADLDLQKIHSIKYLQMALNETLRQNAVLPVVARTSSKSTELGGVRIEPGTKVFIPIREFQNDPEYHPDPEKYSPERFSSEEDAVKGAFMPFGEGPRMCLGSRFAQLIIKFAVINILLNFRILPLEEKPKNLTGNFSIFTEPGDSATLIFKPL